MTSRGLVRLEREDCERLLRSRSLGRVVVKIGDHTAALPVYYAVGDDEVVFRTDPGTKLDAAVLGSRVSFEVDDADEGWSVIVVGHAHEVREGERRAALASHLAEHWPSGERNRVVAIAQELVTGRQLPASG